MGDGWVYVHTYRELGDDGHVGCGGREVSGRDVAEDYG